MQMKSTNQVGLIMKVFIIQKLFLFVINVYFNVILNFELELEFVYFIVNKFTFKKLICGF